MNRMTDYVRYFRYLDKLRESGRVNMWGSSNWLERQFRLSPKNASEITGLWMKTFDPEKSAAERAATLKTAE